MCQWHVLVSLFLFTSKRGNPTRHQILAGGYKEVKLWGTCRLHTSTKLVSPDGDGVRQVQPQWITAVSFSSSSVNQEMVCGRDAHPGGGGRGHDDHLAAHQNCPGCWPRPLGAQVRPRPAEWRVCSQSCSSILREPPPTPPSHHHHEHPWLHRSFYQNVVQFLRKLHVYIFSPLFKLPVFHICPAQWTGLYTALYYFITILKTIVCTVALGTCNCFKVVSKTFLTCLSQRFTLSDLCWVPRTQPLLCF